MDVLSGRHQFSELCQTTRRTHTEIQGLCKKEEQVLIDQGSTAIMGVMQSGNGSILANIRESHMEAEPLLFELLNQFAAVGFTGILDVSSPNKSMFGVPITTNYQGIAMIGGANPIGAFIESGRWADTTAMKGLISASRLVHIDEIV